MEKGLIAISGATGFLGTALIKHFLNEGYRVRAHAHTQDKAQQIDRRVEEVVVGEISDDVMIGKLVTNADFVIHTVSNFRYASGKAESYRRINVTGTQLLIDAAIEAGVKRFLHCSTIGVHGDVAKTPAAEGASFNPGDLYQNQTRIRRICAFQSGPERYGDCRHSPLLYVWSRRLADAENVSNVI